MIEMLFAMGIFGVLLVIFASAVSDFSGATVRTLRTSDQSTQSRVAFDRFDGQLRSVSAINRPVLVGANWYVEYRSDAFVPSTCTQWVLRTDTHTLATRTWVTGVTAVATPTAWQTLATNVMNTTAQPPFGFVPSTTAVPLQRLSVSLRYQQPNGPLTLTSSTFAARNSTTSTVTNPDADGDGDSDTEVCKDITGVRP
jgi:type II secretory pathway pseudopilin PulG